MPYKITRRKTNSGMVYYLRKRDTNEIVSRHKSRAKAVGAMRAREASKHGAVMRNR